VREEDKTPPNEQTAAALPYRRLEVMADG